MNKIMFNHSNIMEKYFKASIGKPTFILSITSNYMGSTHMGYTHITFNINI